MLEYVEQITKDATRISPAFHGRLRAVGFDDRGILQITLIASWFNYINRVADALHHAFAAFGAMMSPDLPLTRRQHEMITTVVSATNRCQY